MDRRKVLLLFGVCVLLTFFAVILMIVYGTHHKSSGTNKENLLKYLKHISGSKTITGLSLTKPENEWNTDLETIKNITGFYPGILLTFMPIYSAGVNKWNSFIHETISKWNDGYLLYFHWGDDGNPLKNMDILRGYNESNYNDLITEGGYLNNIWKRELDVLATYFHQLEHAGVVPICDLLSVINSHSECRGLNGSRKLYQLTHDYLTKYPHLDSLIWVWSIYAFGEMSMLEDFWPGNDYVDVASFIFPGSINLNHTEYQEILNVVRDQMMSMDARTTIPTPEVLVSESRWEWFTLYDDHLLYNSDQEISATFNCPFVINREQNEFFKMLN